MEDSYGFAARNFDLRERTSKTGHSEMWTDEKHSVYLNTIEASFVDQLHDSLDSYVVSNWTGSMASMNNQSNQFEFLGHGRWSQLGLWRDEVEVNQNDKKSRVHPRNRWMQQHYGGEVSIQSNAEVMDQNFTDEDLEGENAIGMRRIGKKKKKKKNFSHRFI